MEPRESEEVQVRVRPLSGPSIEVQVSIQKSGRALKEQIAERFGLSDLSFGVLVSQRPLDETKSLESQGVRAGSSVVALIKAEGLEKGARRERGELEEFEVLNSVIRTLKESAQRKREAKLRALQTRAFGFGVSELESLEVVGQNFATITQLLATRDGRISARFAPFDLGRRRWRLGQWLDVKDTVNKWLEAEIIDMREDSIKVHYNSWAARWDEWIDLSSERLAFFRSKTVQPLATFYMSPVPAHALTGSPARLQPPLRSLRETMAEALPLLRETAAAALDVAQGCAASLSAGSAEQSSASSAKFWERSPRPRVEARSVRVRPSSSFRRTKTPSLRSARSNAQSMDILGLGFGDPIDTGRVIIEESISGESDQAEEVEAESERSQKSADQPGRPCSSVRPPEPRARLAKAAQLAPILDRLGRALIDLAPHFAAWGEDEEVEPDLVDPEPAHLLQPQTLGIFSRFPFVEATHPQVVSPTTRLQFRPPRKIEQPIILTPGEAIVGAGLAHPIRQDCNIDLRLNVVMRSASNERGRNSLKIQIDPNSHL